jgi:hypothetical protein
MRAAGDPPVRGFDFSTENRETSADEVGVRNLWVNVEGRHHTGTGARPVDIEPEQQSARGETAMNKRCNTRGSSSALGYFKDFVASGRRFALFPKQVALVPGSNRDQTASGLSRRRSSGQPCFWPLLLGLILVAATPAWPALPSLPAGVPNIYDPGVLEHFRSAEVGNLHDNPDFPVLLLVNTVEEQPQALLLGLDARNGTDAWSLTADPVILIMLFSDPTTIREAYVDAGFVDLGKASGSYAEVGEESLPALPYLLNAVTEPARGTGVSEGLQGARPDVVGRSALIKSANGQMRTEALQEEMPK